MAPNNNEPLPVRAGIADTRSLKPPSGGSAQVSRKLASVERVVNDGMDTTPQVHGRTLFCPASGLSIHATLNLKLL